QNGFSETGIKFNEYLLKLSNISCFFSLFLYQCICYGRHACQVRRYFLLCIKKAINMEPALLNEVPSLDLADFTSGDARRKQQFVEDLGAAFTNIGFVAIKNHGLSDALRNDLYASVKE